LKNSLGEQDSTTAENSQTQLQEASNKNIGEFQLSQEGEKPETTIEKRQNQPQEVCTESSGQSEHAKDGEKEEATHSDQSREGVNLSPTLEEDESREKAEEDHQEEKDARDSGAPDINHQKRLQENEQSPDTGGVEAGKGALVDESVPVESEKRKGNDRPGEPLSLEPRGEEKQRAKVVAVAGNVKEPSKVDEKLQQMGNCFGGPSPRNRKSPGVALIKLLFFVADGASNKVQRLSFAPNFIE
jgi:hypothetical protein